MTDHRARRPKVEVLDVKVKDVQPFDHTDEGRMVLVMEFSPGVVTITTATVTFEPDDVYLDQMRPVYSQTETTSHSPDAEIRVMRGVPLDAVNRMTLTQKPTHMTVDGQVYDVGEVTRSQAFFPVRVQITAVDAAGNPVLP